MNEAETRFFESRLDIPDEQGYRNTPMYRTAFAAASSHEQRQQVMDDYNNYILFSESDHSPGHWNVSERMYYGVPSEAERVAHRTERLDIIREDMSARRRENNGNTEPTTNRERFANLTSNRGH